MGRHIALLIGASDYRSGQGRGRFGSLEFIPAELDQLAAALRQRGFRQAEVAARGRDGLGEVNKSQVNGLVRDALERARVGDSLLIVLSGHGVRSGGQDYLVPEGVHPADNQTQAYVPISGWADAVEKSEADSVIFLLDACREGVVEDSKSAATMSVRSPTELNWKIDRRRRVACVYACSGLEKSFWVGGSTGEDGTETPAFSLFTRAVTELVAEDGPQIMLTEFLKRVQDRVAELHTLYGKQGPAQTVDSRIISSAHEPGDVMVLPGVPGAEPAGHPEHSYADHFWTGIVARHVAWELVPKPHPSAVESFRSHAAAIAARLAAENDRCEKAVRDDPWYDPTWAQRASASLTQWLTGGPSPESRSHLTTLSPAEAALLVLAPFVVHTAQTRLAAEHHAALVDDAPEFATFIGQFSRECRRMKQAERWKNAEAVRKIRWWLYRRWLAHRSESYQQAVVEPLLPAPHPELPPWVGEALGADRFTRLLNDLRLMPFAISGSASLSAPGLAAEHTVEDASVRIRAVIALGDGEQHHARERLVATLLKTALACAVTVDALPGVVVQNLGFNGQVDLDELRTALQQTHWTTEASGIVLHARSGHHAASLAVETYCTQVDRLLRDIGDEASRAPDLSPLKGLPVRAGVELDAPAHVREAIRFRADEERVLDLLMGRNLYKDPELAIRELYQNALDACRHRELRTEYLRRRGGRVPPGWEGTITFTQGVDECGRAFLTCHDTGIGMGVTEIRDAFAEAGARFVQTPEYVREMALWQRHAEDLKLYPNSRFGIGVLSYFMLADEITVESRRFGIDGRLGQGLKVSIAGPGTLFRIDPLTEGRLAEGGTRVTLFLNPVDRGEPALSCPDVLGEQLWISPFRTVAVHGAVQAEWQPFELRTRTLENHQLDNSSVTKRDFLNRRQPKTVRAEDRRLHWVSGMGMLLADGIRTDQRIAGVVIDLRDDLRPESLSVDRAELGKYDEMGVERLKRQSLPSLISSPVFSYEWVGEQPVHNQAFADDCVQAAAAAGVEWMVEGRRVPVADSGFFLPDSLLIRALEGHGDRRPRYTSGAELHLLVACMPEHVLSWRLRCLLRAGFGGPVDTAALGPELPTAQPSDWALLLTHSPNAWTWLYEAWVGNRPLTDARLGRRAYSRVVEDAGLTVLDMLPRWRSPDQELELSEVFEWVERTDRSAGEVADRFTALGFRVTVPGALAGVGPEEICLLKRLHSGWLEPEEQLSWAQLLVASSRSKGTVAETAARLRELGFGVPELPGAFAEPTTEDTELLDALFDVTEAAGRGVAVSLTIAQINVTAAEVNVSAASVAHRLTELDFQVPAHPYAKEPFDKHDALLLSEELDGKHPWLSPERAPSALHLKAASGLTGLTVEAAVERMRALGFEPAAVEPRHRELSSRDLLVLSSAYQRVGTFLPVDKPVPPSHLAAVREWHGIPPTETRSRLAELGYTLPPESPLADSLLLHDYDLLARFVPGVFGNERQPEVAPVAQVRAAAGRLGRPAHDIAKALAELGCVLAAPAAEFAEPTAGERLKWCMEAAGTEEDVFDLRLDEGTQISLAELTSVAVELGRPFREVAIEASGHGFRHVAEGWFGEVPAREA
ncbi:caspase family protein [Streptomyces sp. NPDC056237]|uniref:wHTH domain-containing protein n=1 Tax=unclassified Streptomyces TaxID=2593676 RepID=UPI0035DBB38D